MEHKCQQAELIWENKPILDLPECISYPAHCPTCGKKYEQVFALIENQGLYDPDLGDYVHLSDSADLD